MNQHQLIGLRTRLERLLGKQEQRPFLRPNPFREAGWRDAGGTPIRTATCQQSGIVVGVGIDPTLAHYKNDEQAALEAANALDALRDLVVFCWQLAQEDEENRPIEGATVASVAIRDHAPTLVPKTELQALRERLEALEANQRQPLIPLSGPTFSGCGFDTGNPPNPKPPLG